MPSGKADTHPVHPAGGKSTAKKSGGVFEGLRDLFISSDPEKEKRKELKTIAKTLRKQNNRLYNPKNELVLPGMARLFFEFYRTLGPAQTVLAHAKSSNVLKAVIIEHGLTMEQVALKERLSEQSIRSRLSQGMGKQTLEEIRNDLKVFSSIFDANRIGQINEQYKSVAVLLHLVHFDYYMLLRKFDPQLLESDHTYTPHFEPTRAQYIADELKDFLEILPAFDPLEDWNTLWGILKAYRGAEAVAPEAWRKLLLLIRRLKRSGELEMVAQLVGQNPFYRPSPRVFKGDIVEEYLVKLRGDTEATLQKVAKEKRTQSIETLSRQVFGSNAAVRLANYSEQANQQFSKAFVEGYSFVSPLNYLHAFLTDFVKKELNGIFDAILIRGRWSDTSMSQLLSECYHQLVQIAESLEQFDAELAPESELGRKLASVTARADRDRQRLYMARRILNKINERARDLLMRACQHCITIGKMLKQVVDDVGKGKPQLILNWSELAGRAQRNLKDMLIADYKKLYYFVQLLKLYI